ncbi:MAG: LPS assembly protein LptD [Acidobacteriota bacterium]
MNLIGAGPCIIEAHPNRGGVSCKTPGLMLHFRMMYKSRFSFRRLVFFFVLSQFFLPLIAQIGSGGISVKAKSWRRDENRIIAWGNVEILYKNLKMFADYVQVNLETKDVHAAGKIIIHLPSEVIQMNTAQFNLESYIGEMDDVKGMIQPSVFYEAKSLKIVQQNEYVLHQAALTSCTQPNPRWQFTCSKATLKKDDYVSMSHAVLKIKKIPIFYLPYFRYPLDKERSTGFLMPMFGFSGSKGMYFSESFYWAIRRNMDATFNMDLYKARGMGGGLEYRYIFDDDFFGQTKLYYFDFNENPERNDPENAYLIQWQHNQPVPGGFHLVADVDLQSSYEFLREFNNNYQNALTTNRRSQVYLFRTWSVFTINAQASQFETYFNQLDRSVIRKTFPGIQMSASKFRLIEPFYFSFSSSFQSWQYGWDTDYEKDKQLRSKSFHFTPTLTVPFNLIPWMNVTTSLSGYLNFYFQSYAPNTSKIVNEPIFTKTYSMDIDLVGPVFYKIFYDREKSPKLKHVIEPTFSFRYDSPIDVSSGIINISYYYRNFYLSYGLINHLLLKEKTGAREILTLGFNQYFYLEPEIGPLRIYNIDGEIPEYSDLSAYLRFYATRYHSVDFALAYNPYYKSFSTLRLSANFGSPTDNLFFNVNWYKSINPYYQNYYYNRHQIGISGGLKIPSLSLETRGQFDFNIQEAEILYSGVSVIYHYQCLDFQVDLRVFYFREKPELQFQFSFGLGNIGKTTDFLGGADFQ